MFYKLYVHYKVITNSHEWETTKEASYFVTSLGTAGSGLPEAVTTVFISNSLEFKATIEYHAWILTDCSIKQMVSLFPHLGGIYN